MITESELDKKYLQLSTEELKKLNQNEKNIISQKSMEIQVTPKSLKQLFDDSLQNSNYSNNSIIRTNVYKNTILDSKLSSIFNSKGKFSQAIQVDKQYKNGNQSQNQSFQQQSGTQTPNLQEYTSNYQKILMMKKESEDKKQNQTPLSVLDNHNTYNQSGATSFYSISSYSFNPETSQRVPSERIITESDFSDEKQPSFKQPQPVNKYINQQQNQQFNYQQTNQKIKKIDQLANLKNIIEQRQINESFKQYQLPTKKTKLDNESCNQLNTNLNSQIQNSSNNTVKSSQGLNTAEKNILYKPEYYQKVGLPMPETVMKQKKLEREQEQLKENLQPQQKNRDNQWLIQKFKRQEQENIQNYQKINKQQQQHFNNINNTQINLQKQNDNLYQKPTKPIIGYRAQETMALINSNSVESQNEISKNQNLSQNTHTNNKNTSRINPRIGFSRQNMQKSQPIGIKNNQENKQPDNNLNESFLTPNRVNIKRGFSQIEELPKDIEKNQQIQMKTENIAQILQDQGNKSQFQKLNLENQKDFIFTQFKDVILMLLEKQQANQTVEENKTSKEENDRKEQSIDPATSIISQQISSQLSLQQQQQKQCQSQVEIKDKQKHKENKNQQKLELKTNQQHQKIEESIQQQNNNQINQQVNIKLNQNVNQNDQTFKANNITSNSHLNQQQILSNNTQKNVNYQPNPFLNQQQNNQQIMPSITSNLSNQYQQQKQQFNNNPNQDLQPNTVLSQHFKKSTENNKDQRSNQFAQQKQNSSLDFLNPKYLNIQPQQEANFPQKPILQSQQQAILSQNQQQQQFLQNKVQTEQQLQADQLNKFQIEQIKNKESQNIHQQNNHQNVTQIDQFKNSQQVQKVYSSKEGLNLNKKLNKMTQYQQQQKEREERERIEEIKKAQIEFKQIQTQNIQKRVLDEHEKKVLYVVWIKKNLQDFNYWIQKSKSVLNFNFSEDKGQFKCEARLSIPNEGIKPLYAQGVGGNKKESKKNAMEQLAIYVILNDNIFWVGITGRQYLESVLQEFKEIIFTPEGQEIIKSIQKYTNFSNDNSSIAKNNTMEIEQNNGQNRTQTSNQTNKNSYENINQVNLLKYVAQLEKINKKEQQKQNKSNKNATDGQVNLNEDQNKVCNKSKLKAQKYSKKMQQSLQENKVIDALERLAQLGSLKNDLNYRDFCYIWNYGIQHKSLTMLKICLDVIHYRKFSNQMIEAIQHQTSADTAKLLFNPTLQNESLTLVNSILQKFISTQRTSLPNNPYELYNTNIAYLVDDEWYTARENPNAHFFSQKPAYQQKYTHFSLSHEDLTVSPYSNIDLETFSVQDSLQIVQKLNFIKSNNSKNTIQNLENSSSSNKQKMYLSAGKKKTVLSGQGGSGLKEDIDLRNQTFVKSSALFFKQEKNFFKNENENTSQNLINRKDPYLQYLNWEDLNQMYQSLLFVDDPVFALQACELIYSQTKIDQDLLINGSLNYFVNRKVILFEDFFESMLIKFNKSNSIANNISRAQLQQQQDSNYNRRGEKFICQGYIQYLGSNYEYDQFSFRVLGENGELLPQNSSMLQEGDLCLLLPKNSANSSLPSNLNLQGDYNNRYICLIKEFSEENGQNNHFNGDNQLSQSSSQLKSASHNYSTFKLSMVISDSKKRSKLLADYTQVYALYRISSTKSLKEKNKSLDNMCTKITMLHSIFNSITLQSTNKQKCLQQPLLSSGDKKNNFSLNSIREETMKQSTIVATEINLQQIAMENNLNQDQVDALYSGSVNALTIIQGVKQTGRFRVATSIIEEWLIQSNLKILIKCDSDFKARQFYNFLVNMQQNIQGNSGPSQSSDNQSKFLQSNAFSANLCMILEDSSLEFFNSGSKQYMTSKMSAKVKRSIDESKIIILGSTSLHSHNNHSSAISPQSQNLTSNQSHFLLQQQSAICSLRDCSFNRILFYNSEQIQESNTWEYLVKNCNQCVMIGDLTAFQREQTRNLLTKSRFGDRSIFENIIQSGFKPIILKKRYLNKQIFMNTNKNQMNNEIVPLNTHKIGVLHNDLFFDNNLILFTSNDSSSQQLQNKDNEEETSTEVLVVALKGKEEISNPTNSKTISDTGSIYNIDEIYLILAIVSSLVRKQKVDLSQIRVITPTIAQKTQVQMISSQKLKIVLNAQTIQEPIKQSYDYIIYSGVKTNEREDIGAARNPAILSTMLQYTNQQFIFVGDIDLYSVDSTWQEFFLKSFAKKQIKFYHKYIQPLQNVTKNLSKIFDKENEKEQGEI